MFKNIFKHTFFYGAATVLPRILTFLLTPLYVSFLPSKSDFGLYSGLMVYMIFGNVLLSYGMETTYFRFINKKTGNKRVERTALTSILFTTILFCVLSLTFSESVSEIIAYKQIYIIDMILILSLDALLVIPFAKLRNNENSSTFAIIKVSNVVINILLNILFLVILKDVFSEDKIHLILVALIIPSLLTFLITIPLYRSIGLGIDPKIYKKMLLYSYPVLISGLAFAINEGIDRLLLRYLLPSDVADTKVGIYSACYKLGAFMAFFTAAFKLGVEPIFFKQVGKANAKKVYGLITYYFVLLGCIILLLVTVYIDGLKHIIIPKESYWEGLWVVPLILIANLFLGIYHNLSVWYKISDKTIYGAIFSIIAAVITLILNFILIPKIGYKGSAIATISAYGIMMILSFVLARRNYKINYPLNKILILLTTSIGFALLSFYTFGGNIYIGNLFIIIFLTEIYFLERKQIKQLLKLFLK